MYKCIQRNIQKGTNFIVGLKKIIWVIGVLRRTDVSTTCAEAIFRVLHLMLLLGSNHFLIGYIL